MSLITEEDSKYLHLEEMSFNELISSINAEDKTVAESVAEQIPAITQLAKAVFQKLKDGGRLFYIGAGTSGRLGIVDASECPPTFSVSHDIVIGLIAGGDSAIRKAVENAEDSFELAWKDLSNYNISYKDFLVGIAASGRTPYVIGGLRTARENGISTGCIVCNPNSEIAKHSDYPVEVVVGPEFLTGSTRMKAGTAQKMVLNMLTTSVMIKLGHVKGNKMIKLRPSNEKLLIRASNIVALELGIPQEEALELVKLNGGVSEAISAYTVNKSTN